MTEKDLNVTEASQGYISAHLELGSMWNSFFEGALLGKEFLPQLSNFSLVFNMHSLLEQLKM